MQFIMNSIKTDIYKEKIRNLLKKRNQCIRDSYKNNDIHNCTKNFLDICINVCKINNNKDCHKFCLNIIVNN